MSLLDLQLRVGEGALEVARARADKVPWKELERRFGRCRSALVKAAAWGERFLAAANDDGANGVR